MAQDLIWTLDTSDLPEVETAPFVAKSTSLTSQPVGDLAVVTEFFHRAE